MMCLDKFEKNAADIYRHLKKCHKFFFATFLKNATFFNATKSPFFSSESRIVIMVNYHA